MKRLTLLTILLVVVGLTAGFAMDVKPSVTLTGTATLEWGIDLDTTPVSTGFKNTADLDMTVNLIAADSTETHAGKDGWYGSIALTNVELYWTATEAAAAAEAGGALGATAKIVGMGGNVVIGVYAAPDLAIDFVGAIENADVDDTVVDIEAEIGPDYAGAGTYVSYKVADALTVGLELVSENPWTTNTANAYALALDLTGSVKPITYAASFNYGFGYAATPIGFGVKVSADTAMIDPWVAFDGSYDAALAWEVGAGATVTMMETVTAAVSALFDSADNFDLKVVFTEPAAKGLVDNLDATLTVYLLDLITALEYEVILAGGYKAGILYPHFSVTYGDSNAAAAFLNVTVGVTADILPLTQFALHWTSRDLLTSGMGTIVAGVKVTY